MIEDPNKSVAKLLKEQIAETEARATLTTQGDTDAV